MVVVASEIAHPELVGGGQTTKHSHPGGSGVMLKSTYDPNADGVIAKAQLDTDLANTSGTNTGDQTLTGLGGIAHSLATAINDFLVASGVGAFVKKTLAETKAILDWAADIATHAGLTTGVHGVGVGTIAKVADIAVDANLSAAGQDAIAKKHPQNTDTDLDATFKATLEKVVNKGAVSGYAPLGADSKVPDGNSQVPSTHPAAATGVHGVGASTVESISGSQAKVDAHKDLTTGVHGAGASTVETIAGSQSKVDTHAAAADPHTAYQRESEKAAANGYAGLGAGGLVPVSQLASGAPDGTKYVRDDGVLATPAGSGAAFPIGSVFLAIVSTNPNTLLGYGTWSQIAQGQFLVGQKATDTDFDVAEEIGGAKTHILTIAEIPAHTHTQNLPSIQTGNFASGTRDASSGGTGGSPTSVADALSTASVGGGGAHNNLPPYLVVYIWKRTA